jgi:LacI family transcriptional regulator
MSMLLDEVEGKAPEAEKDQGETILVPCRVITRASTGAPPSS